MMPAKLAPSSAGEAHTIDELHFTGSSSVIDALRQTIVVLASLEANLLVCGEPGTGHRECAELLHRESARRLQPFVPISLTGLNDTQMTAKLLGPSGVGGLAAQARHATFFIEGIEALSPHLQERLLQALNDSAQTVRIIGATSASLFEQVERGRFSRQLYDRLATVQLTLLPLRERPEDLEPTALRILHAWSERNGKWTRTLAPGARAVLEAYAWPGNVRELTSILESACAQTRASSISAERLRIVLGRRPYRAVAWDTIPLRQLQRDYILHVLARCGGNQSLAAKRLGIGRGTLTRRLREPARRKLRAAS
jgi:DNA-binding NtrC family response regulator